jgi:hypothetical protein
VHVRRGPKRGQKPTTLFGVERRAPAGEPRQHVMRALPGVQALGFICTHEGLFALDIQASASLCPHEGKANMRIFGLRR